MKIKEYNILHDDENGEIDDDLICLKCKSPLKYYYCKISIRGDIVYNVPIYKCALCGRMYAQHAQIPDMNVILIKTALSIVSSAALILYIIHNLSMI